MTTTTKSRKVTKLPVVIASPDYAVVLITPDGNLYTYEFKAGKSALESDKGCEAAMEKYDSLVLEYAAHISKMTSRRFTVQIADYVNGKLDRKTIIRNF